MVPLVHCTTEHGRIFVPVTVSVAPAAPAVAVTGETAAIVGVGSVAGETVKGNVLVRMPAFDT